MTRRLIAALCLAVALVAPVGCGFMEKVDQAVASFDPRVGEYVANSAGTILLNAIDIAHDAGAFGEPGSEPAKAEAREHIAEVKRAERMASQGNFQLAQLIYAQIRAVVPFGAVEAAEEKSGKSLDAELAKLPASEVSQ